MGGCSPAKTVYVEVEGKVEKLEVVCQRSENLKHDPNWKKRKVETTKEKLFAVKALNKKNKMLVKVKI